jgi:protein ImuB
VLGKRRRAMAVAGPERIWGEWWSGAPYRRDYYRVHFEGVGPVWVYRDATDGRFYLQGLFD